MTSFRDNPAYNPELFYKVKGILTYSTDRRKIKRLANKRTSVIGYNGEWVSLSRKNNLIEVSVSWPSNHEEVALVKV